MQVTLGDPQGGAPCWNGSGSPVALAPRCHAHEGHAGGGADDQQRSTGGGAVGDEVPQGILSNADPWRSPGDPLEIPRRSPGDLLI